MPLRTFGFDVTPEVVQEHKYNQWGGNPTGLVYDPSRCAESVHEQGRGGLHYQCQKAPGHGPHGLFCSIHAQAYETKYEIWYRVCWWPDIPKISPVNVVKQTPKFVYFLGGSRSLQKGNEESYHPTFEEAKDKALQLIRAKIAYHQGALTRYVSQLEEMKGLEEKQVLK